MVGCFIVSRYRVSKLLYRCINIYIPSFTNDYRDPSLGVLRGHACLHVPAWTSAFVRDNQVGLCNREILDYYVTQLNQPSLKP